MAKTDFRSVDEYIAAQPKNVQVVLRRVRSIIRNALPLAVAISRLEVLARLLRSVVKYETPDQTTVLLRSVVKYETPDQTTVDRVILSDEPADLAGTSHSSL
jgi:hypothetical protein